MMSAFGTVIFLHICIFSLIFCVWWNKQNWNEIWCYDFLQQQKINQWVLKISIYRQVGVLPTFVYILLDEVSIGYKNKIKYIL